MFTSVAVDAVLETEINSHLDVLKVHLRTVTKDGDATKVTVSNSVKDSIEFLLKYFHSAKIRTKYPEKLAEAKQILRIGAENGLLEDFSLEKLGLLEDNLSRKSGSLNRGLKLSADSAHMGESLDQSKRSLSVTDREKEDTLQYKLMEEMNNIHKNREALTVSLLEKRIEAGKLNQKADTVSIASVPVIDKTINSRAGRSTVESTLPALNKKAAIIKQEADANSQKPVAQIALRKLLRLQNNRPKESTARQRPHHPPKPHSFYSLLDQSREHTRASSAHRSAMSADRPARSRDSAKRGPFYDLLFK